MALRLTEEIVERLVAEVNEANPAYHFDWTTYALTTQQEGRSTLTALFVEGSEYYALIRMGMFDVSTISSVDFIAKSEIQGVKVRKGILNTVLKLRMHNGEFYKLIFGRRGGKNLPHLAENVDRYQAQFAREYANRTDMKNRKTGFLGKLGNVFVWVIAFVATVAAVVLTESKWIAILVFLAVLFIADFVSGKIAVARAARKDKAYLEELDILESTHPDATMEETYRLMQGMNYKPQTEMAQSVYYNTLIQLAHQLGHKDEARQLLALFPRRASEETENQYQALVNLLATEPQATEAPTDSPVESLIDPQE